MQSVYFEYIYEVTTTNRQLPADHKARILWASFQQSTFTCENQRNLGQMNVLANNCVSKISVPKGANSGNGVAYNPVLGLFVTMDLCNRVSVWDPMKGKVMAERNLGEDGQLDMLPIAWKSYFGKLLRRKSWRISWYIFS